MDKYWILTQLASGPSNIRGRTLLILGAVGLAVVGLLAWAGIALLSWMWAQAPAVTEAGKRLAGAAMTQAEQVAPGLKEQAEQWVPGAKAQLAQWLPARADAPPTNDVSGTDVGPVPRFPGLVRSHFARAGQVIEARYVGRAAFDAVLAHYVQGFAAAGYAQEVISASPEEEQHRFRRGQESFELSLSRRPGEQVAVGLKQLSP